MENREFKFRLIPENGSVLSGYRKFRKLGSASLTKVIQLASGSVYMEGTIVSDRVNQAFLEMCLVYGREPNEMITDLEYSPEEVAMMMEESITIGGEPEEDELDVLSREGGLLKLQELVEMFAGVHALIGDTSTEYQPMFTDGELVIFPQPFSMHSL